MHLIRCLIVFLSCLLTLCQTQTYRYPAQRRAGYSYSQPSYASSSSSTSYYNQPKNYYQTSANRNTPAKTSSYYNSLSNPAYSNSYTKPSAQRNSYPYSSSAASYSSYKQPATKKTSTRPYSQSSSLTNSINRNYEATPSPSKGYYRNSIASTSAVNPYSKGSYSSSSNSLNTNQYLSNSYNSDNYKKNTASTSGNSITSTSAANPYSKGSYSSASNSLNTNQYLSNSYNSDNYKRNTASNSSTVNNNNKYRVSKADSENAKFAGADNQENDEDEARTAHLKRRKFHRRFGGGLLNPCSPFGRDAGNGVTPPPKEQGRILWDVNVYNVFPQSSAGVGCGGYGGVGGGLGVGFGGGLGGGLLSDPIAPAYYPPGAGIANFLGLFAPGILQNSLAVTGRPPQYADYGQASNQNNDLQNDPDVDPNYRPEPAPLPVRRPNRVYYDSVGAPPVTPGQLVGGIATTVNGIIQQLTGNVQPVYG